MGAGVRVAYAWIGAAGPAIVCLPCADAMEALGAHTRERYTFTIADLRLQEAPCCERCGAEWAPVESSWAGAVPVALGLVVTGAAPAWAHHETAIAEMVAGAWVWAPAALLAVLGLVDRLRFWWRDGARISHQGRRVRFYCSRALSGAGWHFCHDRAFGVRSFDVGSPWVRVELLTGRWE